MQSVVNGEPKEVAESLTVRGLIELLGLTDGPVAVERNLEVVPRAEHPTTQPRRTRHDRDRAPRRRRLAPLASLGGGGVDRGVLTGDTDVTFGELPAEQPFFFGEVAHAPRRLTEHEHARRHHHPRRHERPRR